MIKLSDDKCERLKRYMMTLFRHFQLREIFQKFEKDKWGSGLGGPDPTFLLIIAWIHGGYHRGVVKTSRFQNVDTFFMVCLWKVRWICIAPRREHTSKALRYGTRSQGISQFCLHTPRSSPNGMNHTCLRIIEGLYIYNLPTSCSYSIQHN